MKLRISKTAGDKKGKSVFLASTEKALEAIRPCLGAAGLAETRSVPLLGVDVQARGKKQPEEKKK